MWEQFFLDFFDQNHGSIEVVLNADGCREGWLQGELYRAGKIRGLRVNRYSFGGGKKADICCLEGSPRMVGEIKILGADYQSKTRYWLDADVERLMAIQDAEIERYMILIIPKCNARSALGDYLTTVCYSETCIERDFDRFRLRLWKLGAVTKSLEEKE